MKSTNTSLIPQVDVVRDENQLIHFRFWIPIQPIILLRHAFAKILRILGNGQCAYMEDWSLDSLTDYQENKGSYYIEILTPDDIKDHIQIPRTIHSHTKRNGEIVYYEPNKIFQRELHTYLRSWEEIIRENGISLARNYDHLNACCAHMLYFLVNEKLYNLAYYIARRIENIKRCHNKVFPYHLLLTCLYHWIMTTFPNIAGPQYLLVNLEMAPIGGTCGRKTRNGMGTKHHHSVSSSSSSGFHNSSSSYFYDDDDENDGDSNGERGTQLIWIQLLQLELRLGKNPSRSFRPLKFAQVFAIGEHRLPIESTIASRSTNVMVESQ
ncbi:hypothetical protein Tco_1246820 [Tanacetum coccineum]